MDYQHRIQAVINYIGQHIDEPLSLEQLSQVACFSKYHFHRLFKANTGLSLQQFVRWLRLKRAAHQLIVDADTPIINIAVNAGFESHEAFTRAFKQHCGLNPSEFRAQRDWQMWSQPPYCLPSQENTTMIVVIKEMPERRLAVLEHRGNPATLGDSVKKLLIWAHQHPLDLAPKPGEAFGFAYDDPETTEPDAFRFDLALTVPEQATLSGDIVEKCLPAGRYAVAKHNGSRGNIGDTVYGLYRDWLPKSGQTLGDLPCIFSYYNLDHEVAETELVTECWLLLK